MLWLWRTLTSSFLSFPMMQLLPSSSPFQEVVIGTEPVSMILQEVEAAGAEAQQAPVGADAQPVFKKGGKFAGIVK